MRISIDASYLDILNRPRLAQASQLAYCMVSPQAARLARSAIPSYFYEILFLRVIYAGPHSPGVRM